MATAATETGGRYSGQTFVRAVTIKGMDIKYAFRTSLPAAQAKTLGQISALTEQGVLTNGIIIGANSPKPPRASRKRANGETDSSFVSHGSIAAARTAGWRVKAGKLTIPRKTKVSFPVFVEVYAGGGEEGAKFNYGWRMNLAQYNQIKGVFEGLGITEVTNANYGDVWFGVNDPKPERVETVLANGSSVSTFVSDVKLAKLPTGWSQISKPPSQSSFGL